MNFEIRINTFSLALGLFSILILPLLLLLDDHQTIPIVAQSSSEENPDKKEDKKDDGGLTTIQTKINLNNIDIKNHDQLKLVSYLNGEGQTTYIDLKE